MPQQVPRVQGRRQKKKRSGKNTRPSGDEVEELKQRHWSVQTLLGMKHFRQGLGPVPDRGYASWRPSCDTALTCFLVGIGGSFWSLGASMEGRSIPTATSDLILVNTVCFFPASSRPSFCSQSYRYLASDAPVACLCLIPLWSWKLSLDRAVDFEASKASAIPGRQRFNFDVTLPTHCQNRRIAGLGCMCVLPGKPYCVRTLLPLELGDLLPA